MDEEQIGWSLSGDRVVHLKCSEDLPFLTDLEPVLLDDDEAEGECFKCGIPLKVDPTT